MFRINKKAFTLIEMLIVVVIIGILAAALIPRLQSVQARARDTKRKADLHQIGTAFEIYKQDNGSYADLHANHNYCGDSWPITDAAHVASNYDDDNVRFVLTSLERYMTSIPLDSSMSSSRRPNDNCNDIYGYNFSIMPRRQSASGSPSYDSMVLEARTESDGSSSNWVYNTSNQSNMSTGEDGGDWHGAVAGYDTDWTYFYAQVYDDYVCSKVTFDSGTTNDGQGTCTANKNGDDLRYVYVQ